MGREAATADGPAAFFSEGWNGRTWAIEHFPAGKGKIEPRSETGLYMR